MLVSVHVAVVRLSAINGNGGRRAVVDLAVIYIALLDCIVGKAGDRCIRCNRTCWAGRPTRQTICNHRRIWERHRSCVFDGEYIFDNVTNGIEICWRCGLIEIHS